MDRVLYICGVIAAMGAAVEMLRRITRWLWQRVNGMWRKLNQFLDDWHGVPDRDGVPGRSGVMVRLLDLEEAVAELRPNGGGSIKDKVNAIARATGVDKS